jgi:hypothetical protein
MRAKKIVSPMVRERQTGKTEHGETAGKAAQAWQANILGIRVFFAAFDF